MTILWTVDGDETSWASWADGMAQAQPSALACELVGRYAASSGEWALDLGCGVGRAFSPLAKAGYRVIGIDPVFHGLQIGLVMAQQETLPAWPICAQAGYIPLPTASVALVLSMGVIFHLSPPELKMALHELRRVLRPGGEAILHFLDSEDWRRTLGRPTAPENIPALGHRAVFTCFCSRDEIKNYLRGAGLKLKSLELRSRQSEQGEMRDWIATAR